jgi:peptidoglycan/xylan/chitin deacetylase (PgdA/CDA1 family)
MTHARPAQTRQRLSRLAFGGGCILCYHALTSSAFPSSAAANVPASDFLAMLRTLGRFGTVVPLSELLERYLRGETIAGMFAVTMDDAYRSVLDLAAEFVRTHHVPVTVFPTLEGAEHGRAFWWDRVDDLYHRIGPDRWRRFEDAVGLPQSFRDGQPEEFGPLRPLRQWILARWAGRWPAELGDPLAELEADAGFVTVQRPMTFRELDAFAALPGVEVGVHTVSHPVLPLLPEADQRREMASCAEILRARYANFAPVLAVPFGLFDAATERTASACGLRALTLAGPLDGAYQPGFGVPRVCVVRRSRPSRLLARVSRPYAAVRWFAKRVPPEFPSLPSAAT